MHNCKGCLVYVAPSRQEHPSVNCSMSTQNKKDGNCPCTLCIVKTMCMDPCDSYNINRRCSSTGLLDINENKK
jgi:hypothetical protein